MNQEDKFKQQFMGPLIDCYGAIKFPAIRVRSIWEKLKRYPDHIYRQCAEKIILNFDNFPGIQAILNTCAEVAGEYSRKEAEELKAKIKCFRCRSQGVVVVNNYAYKCTCQLGELLYPVYPLYEGQVQIQEKIYTDDEGNRIFEDANYMTVVPPGCKNIRLIKTVVKQKIDVLDKKESPEMKRMSFANFGDDIA